ncbi:ATP-binding protein [Anaerolineales bacterium HSG25]|nr:ATP-binding protein [Anaerolineales bacterium HSG25]
MNPHIIRLDIPATHQYLNVVTDCINAMLSRANVSIQNEQTSYNITLAVQELCTNIVNHAYAGQSGRIQIGLKVVPETKTLTVELQDTAPTSFDVSQQAEPTLDKPQVHGLGLWLVQQMIDEVVYYARNGRIWHYEKQGSWRENTVPTDKQRSGNRWQLTTTL